MKRATALGVALVCASAALPAWAQEEQAVVVPEGPIESPRSGAIVVRAGGYKPEIDKEKALNGATPYKDTFGESSLLVIELEMQRFFYQGIGTAGVGLSAGYGEKYAAAKLAGGGNAAEKTALKLVPLQLNGFYKFDYAAFEWGIPLVPYGKLGLVYTPWWVTKGDSTNTAQGIKGSGGKWGWAATAGVSFLLDVLQPRFARDFDSDLGVNHSYLFAEYSYADVDNFGAGGLDLSSRRWMFGLTLDY
ncbi:MXAN_2562 family outer membrane beta-barrel protein [Myxococcus sp. K15C18031901]|uniref:MXAN_2562 family outer membrane beta-barrel protein n=1 Tax=Myxococcus dinghuensis TaxID=2906761 RepID=UPI0020A70387|nr:MXAN_2562 family outer membrane beta-barrel protein [Myxococcus dinghuensis]MCP3097739.1 MXAN_2562 family outer membrane beta-barrel protein [Myxococcus dinghuensis]